MSALVGACQTVNYQFAKKDERGQQTAQEQQQECAVELGQLQTGLIPRLGSDTFFVVVQQTLGHRF